jgi:hypothetical protein
MQIRIFIGAALVLCTFSGCGKEPRPAGFPALYPCKITITQGGQPLEGALVRLMPESGKSEWVTSGTTNASGVAAVVTHAKFSGAPEGTFKVCVSKTQLTPSKYPPPADNAPQSEWDQWKEQTSSEKRQKAYYVKPEYDDVKATPHSLTITQGKNRATFDVGEAVEIVVQ